MIYKAPKSQKESRRISTSSPNKQHR